MGFIFLFFIKLTTTTKKAATNLICYFSSEKLMNNCLRPLLFLFFCFFFCLFIYLLAVVIYICLFVLQVRRVSNKTDANIILSPSTNSYFVCFMFFFVVVLFSSLDYLIWDADVNSECSTFSFFPRNWNPNSPRNQFAN